MKEKNLHTLGLDIGSHSVKCAELLYEDGRFKLSQLVHVAPASNTKEAVKAALNQIFSKKTFTAKKIRVAISGPSLLIRRVQLPKLTYSELKGAIRFEAESHIPFPIDDCFLDFQILDTLPDKKLMNVLLVAAKKDLVMERIQSVSDLGMNLEIVDVDAFCAANAFEVMGDAPDKVYGLLNIGHQNTSFVILQDRMPFYVREIAFGGKQITKAFAALQGVSEEEAEKVKLAAAPESAEAYKAAVQKGLEGFVEELRHAVDYFENESAESLKWIGLSGGAASAAVSSVLSEELGKTVALWDPLKKLEFLPGADKAIADRHAPAFAVAVGLALRGKKEGK